MGKYDDDKPAPNDAQVILDAGKQLGKLQAWDGFKPFVIVGDKMVTLEPSTPDALHHIEADPKFRDATSFIAYVNRFKTDETQLFADERAGTIKAVLDYHSPVGRKPDRLAHIATLICEKSPEWQEWEKGDGANKTQEQFAEFIEDQAPFIVRPDAATMLEIASSIQASSQHTFAKAIRLDNGQTQLQYVQNINGAAGPRGSLEIPKDFDLQLRPFVGCSAYKLTARLRYRIDGGRLIMWYDLFRAPDVLLDAFKAIMLGTQESTRIPVYLGAF